MRDIALFGFMMAILALGLRRPFIFVLAYAYVDVLAPQRFTYRLLNQMPISLICFGLAVMGWIAADKKAGLKIVPRQVLMVILLVYCWQTTRTADFPMEAADKWSWVWKALVFAIFLPFTLRTKLRMESLAIFLVASVATIIILGGIKTIISGGGYGSLNLLVSNNSGIYESSIISMVAIAVIPIILYLLKHNSFFPENKWSRFFAYSLIFACLLMPVGTQARTGLICAALLFVLMLRHVKRRFVYLGSVLALGLIAYPFLPSSFTNRMSSIGEYKADSSASTRIEVWKWTLGYVKDHPFGGGFESYRQNKLHYETSNVEKPGVEIATAGKTITDEARAFHSSYFEMLGEQGYPGLMIWLLIHVAGLIRMEILSQRYRKRAPEDGQWIGHLATALQQSAIVYLVGSVFVGAAFQSYIFMFVGLQIALDVYASKRRFAENWQPMRRVQSEPITQGV